MTRPSYDVRVDWDHDGDWDDIGENVTVRALARTPISIQYGRDQARALGPVQPGTATFELDNRSGDYSPENPASPLVGNLGPGRPVRIAATYNSIEYVLYHGFLDDYNISPDIEHRSASFTALDCIARLQGVKLSTDLHFSIKTGQAIGHILDAAGWPALDRVLDQGATIMPWWWEEGTDALTALTKILEAEGPPSLVTVNDDCHLVFRDRHHRLTETASLTSQATFRGKDIQPVMSPPLIYDMGWRDIVNDVSFAVDIRQPSTEWSVVWENDGIIPLSTGETVTVNAMASEPFINAITPELVVPSEDPDEAPSADYTVLTGAVEISLSRTSGQSAVLSIFCTVGPALVQGLRLRAYPVSVARTVKIEAHDPASVSKHTRRSYPKETPPWVGVHDALAVAQLILGRHAERRPVVFMRVAGGHDTRIIQQLTRDLSDRVTIVEPTTDLDADFFIEQIRHTTDGVAHETVFGCEKAPIMPTNVFRFDTTGAGFNDGQFLGQGIDDPDTIFRMDGDTGHRFDEGVFAT